MTKAWCHEVGMETASLVLTLGESLMAPLLPPVIIPRIHQASRHLSINQTSRAE